jgi:hypothetical protein
VAVPLESTKVVWKEGGRDSVPARPGVPKVGKRLMAMFHAEMRPLASVATSKKDGDAFDCVRENPVPSETENDGTYADRFPPATVKIARLAN